MVKLASYVSHGLFCLVYMALMSSLKCWMFMRGSNCELDHKPGFEGFLTITAGKVRFGIDFIPRSFLCQQAR